MDTAASPATRTARQSLERATAIARKYGYDTAATAAETMVDASFHAGNVVVVGEIKRGKSSLVNALIGRRDLLPVDVLTSTSAPIRVSSHGAGDIGGEPVVNLVRGGQRTPVAAAELRDWVTVDGLAATELGSDEDPATAATIDLDYPALTGTTLVDTPGVGGLDEHAVSAAFSEAHRAGVLLVVCDASTPITKPEMEILAEARDQVGAVIVVVTKTDKNLRRWADIVADDRRLIREHLGVDVPVIGVSSLRALDAVDEPDPQRAGEIAARSGIVELRDTIRRALDAPETMGLRRALEKVVATLTSIRTTIAEDIRVFNEPSEGVVALEQEQQELETLREHAAEWEQLLARDISFARSRINDELDARLQALVDTWTQRINSEGMRVLRSKPQVFTSQIEAELNAAMQDTLAQLIEGLRERAAELFDGNEELTGLVVGAALQSVAPDEIKGREVGKKTKDLADPTMLSMGFIGASMLTMVIPLAPLAGGVWIGVNMAYRAMRTGKQQLVTWLRETHQTTRTATVRLMDTMVTAARTEMVLRYRAHIRQRQKEVQERMQKAKDAARTSESERKQSIERLTKNEKIVAATIDEINAHLGRLNQEGEA